MRDVNYGCASWILIDIVGLSLLKVVVVEVEVGRRKSEAALSLMK